MLAFHLDFNTAAFRIDYLKQFLTRLRQCGYDTIIWELEGYVKWDSCPESAAADALSKTEFVELIEFTSSLGLENIPLLQCFGHCEYVLKNPKYISLRENPDEHAPYCPSSPDISTFLENWIEEYLTIFKNAKYFHLGCDEVWRLGTQCERCRNLINRQSKSNLIVNHVNAVAEIALKYGVIPMVWADMALIDPESIESLSKKIILLDWRYELFKGCGQVWCWDDKGGRLTVPKDISDEVLELFGKFLYPNGDEPGQMPETFYTADYLKSLGFKVVLCASTSCFGDNVFAGRNYFHLRNVADFVTEGARFEGTIVTSWTVHLFPYELQSAIMMPKYKNAERFVNEYPRDMFGIDGKEFFRACGYLAKYSLFTSGRSSGHGKTFRAVSPDHMGQRIAVMTPKERSSERENSIKRLAEYRKGVEMFKRLAKKATSGHDIIKMWLLAAQSLVNRARIALLLLEEREDMAEAEELLAELLELKIATTKIYMDRMYPIRAKELLYILFGTAEYALRKIK